MTALRAPAPHAQSVFDYEGWPTRDTLAEPALLAPVQKKLGRKTSAHMFDQADDAFHVPSRSGRDDGDVVTEIFDAFARWTTRMTA